MAITDVDSTTPMEAGDIAVDNLYPALIKCFAVILSGYVAGRLGILPQSEAKGLNTFVANFSLPCLIFLSIAKLDLSSVNWKFLLAILISKGIVFLGVAVVTLVVSRPLNMPRAGLFAIFCTQSNDFAIGFPILVALYQNTHPAYPSYLYLMAPISLVILNPLGFILMELGRTDSSVRSSADIAPEMRSQETMSVHTRFKIVWQVLKGIISNPVVFMTALGIAGNLVFQHHLPVFLSGILEVFGLAFSATALFLLGLRMVGKVHKLQGTALIVPGLLIIVKLLTLPLISREIVSVLHAGENSSDTEDLSTFGFLYGTFPSAPGVFVFATQYGVEVDLIASSMVACTFVSAPLMFVSAKMISISSMLPPDYIKQLNSFAFDIAIASVVSGVWLILAFILCAKIKRLPHRMTFYLMVFQLFSSIGVILGWVLSGSEMWHLRLQFAVYAIGDLSSRLCTGFIALGLLLLQSRSLCLVMRLEPFFLLLTCGIPLLVVAVLLLSSNPVEPSGSGAPSFTSLYGDLQAAVSLGVLVISFSATVVCLALHQRYQRRFARYLLLVQDVSDHHDTSQTNLNHDHITDVRENSINSVNEVVDIEEICAEHGQILQGTRTESGLSGVRQHLGDLCPTRSKCAASRRNECNKLVEDYHNQLAEEEEDRQIQRHQVMLLSLCCSMFLSMAVCTWRLVMDSLTGIYVELAFLEVSLNQGQGVILLAVFGLHSKALIFPIISKWKDMWVCPAVEIQLPAWDELEFQTRHVCDTFITHHFEACSKAISKDKRWRFRLYRQCFRGSEIVDWLLQYEIVRSREEAVEYCNHLVLGQVIQGLGGSQHFQDAPLLYSFSPPMCRTLSPAASDSF